MMRHTCRVATVSLTGLSWETEIHGGLLRGARLAVEQSCGRDHGLPWPHRPLEAKSARRFLRLGYKGPTRHFVHGALKCAGSGCVHSRASASQLVALPAAAGRQPGEPGPSPPQKEERRPEHTSSAVSLPHEPGAPGISVVVAPGHLRNVLAG